MSIEKLPLFSRSARSLMKRDIKDLKDLRHSKGNPLACACGMRGPTPYGEGNRFLP